MTKFTKPSHAHVKKTGLALREFSMAIARLCHHPKCLKEELSLPRYKDFDATDLDKKEFWRYCPQSCECKKNHDDLKPLDIFTGALWSISRDVNELAWNMSDGYCSKKWIMKKLNHVLTKLKGFTRAVDYHRGQYRRVHNHLSEIEFMLHMVDDILYPSLMIINGTLKTRDVCMMNEKRIERLKEFEKRTKSFFRRKSLRVQ